MSSETILVVSSDEALRGSLSHMLTGSGSTIHPVADAKDAIPVALRTVPDVVVLSLHGYASGIDGFELLEILRRGGCDAEVVAVASASGRELETLVSARQSRIQEVLWAPVDAKRLRMSVKLALKARSVRRGDNRLFVKSHTEDPQQLIGTSGPMLEVKRRIAAFAMSGVSVLLEGETGVGKEVVARTIHEQSRSSTGDFVAVNCAAMPESLIESELFGHRKGAFTGAIANRNGFFQQAEGGTLFLDEIGDAPPRVQTKLLRVLQEKAFIPVGGEAEVRTTARVIAATNRDLKEMARTGGFRADLLHRLSVVRILVPPLRERMDDIDALVEYLVERAVQQVDADIIPYISDEALDTIRFHRWPGNVRELEHALMRAVVSAAIRGIILAKDLALNEWPASNVPEPETKGSWEESGKGPAAWVGPDGRLLSYDEGRTQHILAALRRCGGNVAETARHLGLPRSTLYDRMSKLGIGGGG